MKVTYLSADTKLVSEKNDRPLTGTSQCWLSQITYQSRGESAALGRRMPRPNRRFTKSMRGKVLNFLHVVEKMISVISVQV